MRPMFNGAIRMDLPTTDKESIDMFNDLRNKVMSGDISYDEYWERIDKIKDDVQESIATRTIAFDMIAMSQGDMNHYLSYRLPSPDKERNEILSKRFNHNNDVLLANDEDMNHIDKMRELIEARKESKFKQGISDMRNKRDNRFRKSK